MMKGGLAAVLDKNLMYVCQLVDLRCQRVLEEADWRLRLARALGKRLPQLHTGIHSMHLPCLMQTGEVVFKVQTEQQDAVYVHCTA